MMQFELIEGIKGEYFKLSQDNKWSLAHYVSQDMRSCDTIARQFGEWFGQEERLVAQDKNVGEVAWLEENTYKVFYLVCKAKWRDPVISADVKTCLESLRQHCKDHGIAKLAFLQTSFVWNDLIRQVFCNSGIHIRIYQFSS